MQVDADTYEMLRALNMANLPGVKPQQVNTSFSLAVHLHEVLTLEEFTCIGLLSH